MNKFCFFAGIDGVAPVINGARRDQQEIAQHNRFWKEDFNNVLKIGMDTLRWGPNWYQTNPEKGEYNWTIPDERMAYAESIGLDIWFALQHKQVPDFIQKTGDILSPYMPSALTEYGLQVIRRYPQIKRLTVTIEADFYSLISCKWGDWAPHKTDKFEEAIQNFGKTIIQTADAIKKERPDIEIIHTDFAPGLWLASIVKDHVDAMALDYYIDHGESLPVWIQRWWDITGKPLYIGETDLPGGACDHDINAQIKWLRDTLQDCRDAVNKGIPMRGYSPYPTVTDNLYWGTNQCSEYECNYLEGFMGDNAGSMYRFKPDAEGTLWRVPVPEMIEALHDEMGKWNTDCS